jgi:eukaryotic-like serine/threonine-protein kinase
MNRLLHLVHEVHRRSLWQVLAIYLGASWLVLQVVSLIVQHLALPAWVTPVALVLLLVGLPIVLATAFVQEGVQLPRRAAERRAEPDAAIPSASVPARPATLLTWRNALVGGVLAFASLGLVGSGYVGLRAAGLIGAEQATKVDANAVAILPFRVTGDSSLVFLREGMLDLVAPKLPGDGGGPRALDSRSTLVAYRRAAQRAELGEPEALALARSLGAGRVLLGEVVGVPGGLSLSARLLGTGRSGAVAQTTLEGPVDSLPRLVDRMVAQLLARDAGEDARRLETLTSASLPALRHYLVGQQAYRSGQFDVAVARFREAITIDSTFVLAGLYLAFAHGWERETGADWSRGIAVAQAGRDRLSERDRALLDALVGAGGPRSPVTHVRDWEKALDRAGNQAEAWYGYGDAFFHSGQQAGYPDALERARNALRRAVELDSTLAPALHHLVEVELMLGDLPAARGHADRYFQLAGSGRRDRHYLGWLIVAAEGDTAQLVRFRQRADSLRGSVLTFIARYAQIIPLQPGEARHYADVAAARAATEGEHWRTLDARLNVAYNSGRAAAAEQISREAAGFVSNFDEDLLVLEGALVGELVPEVGEATFARVAARQHTGVSAVPAACYSALWHARTGRAAPARAALARLAEAQQEITAETAPPTAADEAHLCALLSEAALAVSQGAPEAARRLDELERAFGERAVSGYVAALAATLAVQLREEAGDARGVLAICRRFAMNPTFLATRLLAEARAHERLGQREQAVRAYRHFLELRTTPDPGHMQATVDEARGALARLTGDRG